MAGNTGSGVRVIDLDIPFLNLTWFFVKASLALSFAVALTSWVWVLIGTGMATLSALLVVGLGVPTWFGPMAAPTAAPVAAPAPPAVVVVPAPQPPPPPPPAAAAVPAVPEPAAPPAPNPDANRAATEAAQRAELERSRREKAKERQ